MPDEIFSDLLSDLSSLPDPSQSNDANQRKWTFDFGSLELKRDFLATAASKGITAGSLANRLIHAFLLSEGYDHPKTDLVRAGRGRPIGSQNKERSSTSSSATSRQRVTEPKTRRRGMSNEVAPIPTHEEIQLMVMENRFGLYPVGEPRRLTPQDKRELLLDVINNRNGRTPGIEKSEYVDEVGNYFRDDWGWWYQTYFAGAAGSNRGQLAVWAVQKGKWFPDDPKDYRLPQYLLDKLFDESGNRRETVEIPKTGVQLEDLDNSDESTTEN